MKISSRTLNKGEIFPSSFRAIKNVFKDTPFNIDFSVYDKKYGTFMHTPDYYYLKNRIQGQVVAALYTYPRNSSPTLHLYTIKESQYSRNLQTEFEQEYLAKFLDFYSEVQTIVDVIDRKTRMMLVELVDGKFVIHRMIFPK
jgi:hypothetical protein